MSDQLNVAETAWLIESRFTPGPSWWMGTSHPAPWTRDSLKAVRFCRKQDAEAAMATLPDAHMCFVSEHVWGFVDESLAALYREAQQENATLKEALGTGELAPALVVAIHDRKHTEALYREAEERIKRKVAEGHEQTQRAIHFMRCYDETMALYREAVEALEHLIEEPPADPPLEPIIKHWSHTGATSRHLRCPRCMIDAVLAKARDAETKEGA